MYHNKNLNIKKKKKFYSFLNATLLGRGERIKFNVLFNIPIYDKKAFKFGHIEELTPKNLESLLTIYSGYFIFWFAFFNFTFEYFKNLKEKFMEKEDYNKLNLYDKFLNIDTFYYFFKFYFNEFLEFNDIIFNISESYVYDLNFTNNYIDIYNLNFYYSLDLFFLLLNMDKLKYEHDKYLTPEKDWEKVPKRDLNHFDFDLLNHSDNFFNVFYIIENLNNFKSIEGHWVNYDFFDLYFLYSNTISQLNYDIDKNEMELACNEDDWMPFVLINYRIQEKFDLYYVLLRNFRLTIALDFFLIFNFYTIYLRRLRYNYYMRNLSILNEYTRLKVLFILVNNPFGKNKTQVDILKFQKMFTKKFYSKQLGQKRFNKKFKFFLSIFSRRRWFYFYNKNLDIFTFKLLIKDLYINFILKFNDTKLKGLKALKDSESKFLLYNFIYDGLNDILDFWLFSSAFKLLMKFKSVFKFALEGSTYLELCEFIDVIYTSPIPIIKYYFNLQISLYNKWYFNLYYNNFIIPNFFKDFYHIYKDNNYYFYYLKLTSFFVKLYVFIVCGIDILFFRVYLNNFFYKWTWPYLFFLYYASIFFVYFSIEDLNKISYIFIERIEMFMWHLNWKLNISPYIDYMDVNISVFFYTHGLVNAINISRLHNLYNKTLYYFKYNNLQTIHENFKYSIYLKNFYFTLLYENLEYSLIFIFFNLDRILKLFKIKFYESTSERLNVSFIYQYYYLKIILDHDRYKDWFDDWSKREFWIYYYWKQYEGYEFYKKRNYY